MESEVSDVGIGDDILVVDDTPANLVAMEAALAPLGRRVVLASSGPSALARLLEQDFALIVLDVAMPGMTGIEAARLIRARERNRGTPIVFVTGIAWQDDAIDEAYEAGGHDFLMKPFRPELLRAKVRVFLKLQERTRALRRQAEQLHASQARLHDHELAAQRARFESALLDAKLQHLTEGARREHELAGMIGHELVNPLHTLRVAFDLLREHPNADRGGRIYPLIEHWLAHVTRLVEGLIDVAQLASGQLATIRETLQLVDLLRRALDGCEAIIRARRLTVRLDAGPGAPLLVLGDPARLVQAITVVLDHAVRSTTEGGELAIACWVSGCDSVIRIAYAGRGFGPAALPRIFDLHLAHGDQASAEADEPDDPGDPAGPLRLGFALARRLLELHDGAIRVSSDGAGHGATFEIRLPQPPQDVELTSLDHGDPLSAPAIPAAELAAQADALGEEAG